MGSALVDFMPNAEADLPKLGVFHGVEVLRDDVRGGPNSALSLRQARLNFGVAEPFDRQFVSKVMLRDS
jgi:hypothetical protein